MESPLAEQFRRHTFAVTGMDCPNCAAGLEEMARQLPGVQSVSVQFSTARMRVELDRADTLAVPRLLGRAQAMGFTLTDTATVRPAESRSRIVRLRDWFLSPAAQAMLSFALLLLGMLLEYRLHSAPVLSRSIYCLSIVTGGYRFAVAAVTALRSRVISTHLLMTLAALGALLSGFDDEAAMVIALYAVGLALENMAMERTRRSLKNLIESVPQEAIRLFEDGRQETVTPETLREGDRILILPGGRVPADGRIESGASSLVEAAITGESTPRDKTVGDRVFAGTTNGEGVLHVRLTAPASDSTLARILHLVEKAHEQKAPAQAAIERFGRVYTPMVLALAAGIALIGPIVAPGSNSGYQALTLLVVACPCALVIATPVAYVAAISRAARAGILIKGGLHLESLAAVRRVFFDKTGTLTTGSLVVTEVSPTKQSDPSSLLALAAAVESHSEHPIAQAVVGYARERDLQIPAVESARAVPGRGIEAIVEGTYVWIGNAAFVASQGNALPAGMTEDAVRLASRGQTSLFVVRDGVLLGRITVADRLRPETPTVIHALRRRNLTPVMLTGDRQDVAQSFAQAANITEVHADLLPEEKQRIVGESPVMTAMVGDGINDAPALALATVGIAMGAGGTAAAIEAADMALMRSDLNLLPEAVDLARATRQTVRINIAIAVLTVIVLLAGTLNGKLTLPVGVLGHEGSALLVTLNGIRLLLHRYRP